MLTKEVTISGTTAVSVYELIKSILTNDAKDAVETFNQQLKFNILFQVLSSNSATVYIGDATNQAFALPKASSATVTNQYEFNKVSITDIYVKGTTNDKVNIILLPCSN
jgi:soluble P-type ATPase